MRELWSSFVRWWERPNRKERLVMALEDIAESQNRMAAYLSNISGYEGRRNTREQTMYQAWQDMQEPGMVLVPDPQPVNSWNDANGVITFGNGDTYDYYNATYSTPDGQTLHLNTGGGTGGTTF